MSMVYANEHESDMKLSQIDYESGTFESESLWQLCIGENLNPKKKSRVNAFRQEFE